MAKTAMVRARMEPELKAQVEDILSQVGLTTSQAITMFYRGVVAHDGIPFELRIPNKETREAIESLRTGEGVSVYENLDELKAEFR